MLIGEKTYQKGLGHHANGEIVVELGGQYSQLQAWIGVQWQGGQRGSVVFQVQVDGKTLFQSPPMSDSDPAQELNIPLTGAEQLRLIALDGGDGIACDMANWAEARIIRQEGVPFFGLVATKLGDQLVSPAGGSFCGLSILAQQSGPQVAVMAPANMFSVDVGRGESVTMSVPVGGFREPLQIVADVTMLSGEAVDVELAVGNQQTRRRLAAGESTQLSVSASDIVPNDDGTHASIACTTLGVEGEACVRWTRVQYQLGDNSCDVPLRWSQPVVSLPPPAMPALRPAIAQELIEWDWRMQDGIGTERQSRSWAEAVATLLERGDSLLINLGRESVSLGDLSQQWEDLRTQWQQLSASSTASDTQWEDLWRRGHLLRRRIVLANPLADTGPLMFVKRVPSCFSHQLTQYYGMCARPGGGICVLDFPGESMQCRELTQLPPGSYQHLDISWDGDRAMFAYCPVETAPEDRTAHPERHYNLFEMAIDGSDLHQVTHGPYDDFSPRYLPDGKLLFISTRRGGYHRCGGGPCPVYTLATANADGSDARPISYHETHEWDPAVLHDGRIVYTRWDYVDRHAVHYQQLWACRPDGSNVTAYYGNNTLNPVGVWEARPIPNSDRVMATAAAHHAMTAGSIILLDVSQGIDGLDPITRITPDALFPESEAPVQSWHAPAGITTPPEVPVEAQRWPGHCYRTPYPLSEDYFLAAYSYEPLIGEPSANEPNMFGLYLMDRFGNKELIYRDLNISSLWPMTMRARPRPPVLPACEAPADVAEGTFFLQNVYDSWPALSGPDNVTIKQLRILQVMLKTTPHANNPKVGLANASPGKQVLGTVPVEADGSAYFRAPARVPLSFQALDEHGMAVQTMRSLTYLQPGEQTSCVGCHEHRWSTPQSRPSALALQRGASHITPGPDGSKPLSYPLLVQGVLDKHCVSCHRGSEADGGIALEGDPQGAFSVSYNTLAPLVPFSEWKGTPADNSEPLTPPNHFGARASKLMQLIRQGHEGVTLPPEDLERLITWMDANALFYGTFDPQDQARQQRGERIEGPPLE